MKTSSQVTTTGSIKLSQQWDSGTHTTSHTSGQELLIFKKFPQQSYLSQHSHSCFYIHTKLHNYGDIPLMMLISFLLHTLTFLVLWAPDSIIKKPRTYNLAPFQTWQVHLIWHIETNQSLLDWLLWYDFNKHFQCLLDLTIIDFFSLIFPSTAFEFYVAKFWFVPLN